MDIDLKRLQKLADGDIFHPEWGNEGVPDDQRWFVRYRMITTAQLKKLRAGISVRRTRNPEKDEAKRAELLTLLVIEEQIDEVGILSVNGAPVADAKALVELIPLLPPVHATALSSELFERIASGGELTETEQKN